LLNVQRDDAIIRVAGSVVLLDSLARLLLVFATTAGETRRSKPSIARRCVGCPSRRSCERGEEKIVLCPRAA